MGMRITANWIQSFEKLAQKTNSMIVPANVSDIAGVTSIFKKALNFSNSDNTQPQSAIPGNINEK